MRCEAIALALALLTACTPELCSRNSDCVSGLVCTQAGACAIPVDTSGDAGTDGAANDAATDAPADAAPDVAVDAGEPIDAEIAALPSHYRRVSRLWRRR